MFGWSCKTAADTKSSKASPNRPGQKQHVSRAKCRQSIASNAGTAASSTCVKRKADGMIRDKNLCHMWTHANPANACSRNMAMTSNHVHAYTHTRAGLPHQAWTISGQKRDPAVSHHEAVSVTVISWHVGSGAVCLQLFAGCVELWL